MDIPTKYGLTWYSTSILGSWNSCRWIISRSLAKLLGLFLWCCFFFFYMVHCCLWSVDVCIWPLDQRIQGDDCRRRQGLLEPSAAHTCSHFHINRSIYSRFFRVLRSESFFPCLLFSQWNPLVTALQFLNPFDSMICRSSIVYFFRMGFNMLQSRVIIVLQWSMNQWTIKWFFAPQLRKTTAVFEFVLARHRARRTCCCWRRGDSPCSTMI